MNQPNLGGRSPKDIAQLLRGMNFPAQKDDVVHQAEAKQADGGIIDMLRNLPPGAYKSVSDVMQRLGLPASVADVVKGFGARH